MKQRSAIGQQVLYYGFLAVCILGFFLSCCGFFFYRLLVKPLVFFLMLLAISPLMLFHQLHILGTHKDKKNDMFVGESQAKEL